VRIEEKAKVDLAKVLDEKLKTEEKAEREKLQSSKIRSAIVASGEKQIKSGFSQLPKVFEQKVLAVKPSDKKGSCVSVALLL
jgi:hypothetical protein